MPPERMSLWPTVSPLPGALLGLVGPKQRRGAGWSSMALPPALVLVYPRARAGFGPSSASRL